MQVNTRTHTFAATIMHFAYHANLKFRPMCLLVMVTIRGIPNPVSSLPSIGVTNRGRKGRAHR